MLFEIISIVVGCCLVASAIAAVILLFSERLKVFREKTSEATKDASTNYMDNEKEANYVEAFMNYMNENFASLKNEVTDRQHTGLGLKNSKNDIHVDFNVDTDEELYNEAADVDAENLDISDKAKDGFNFKNVEE